MGSITSIATAIKIAFNMVPTPGFSLRGIHKNKTTTLTIKVAWPIVQPNWLEIPCANTVQGATPSPAAIIMASPVPNIHKPIIKITKVFNFGRVDIGLSELQVVVGTFLANLNKNYSPFTQLEYSFVDSVGQHNTLGRS